MLLSGDCSTSSVNAAPTCDGQISSHDSYLDDSVANISGSLCLVHRMPLINHSPIEVVLSCHDIDIRAINAMARFYLTLRPVKPTRCSDLNLMPCANEYGFASSSRSGLANMSLPRSPWDLGCRYNIDMVNTSHILKKLSCVEDIDEYVFIH